MDFSRHIKPLIGETDGPMWKWKISDLLDYHEGAIEVIEGKLKRSESIDAEAQESVRKQHKERCNLYRKANSYAKSMIASIVTDAVYQIMDKETAFEAWEALKQRLKISCLKFAQSFLHSAGFQERIPCGIKAVGNETLAVLGKGTIKVKSTINGKCQEVVLKDVWYVPKINRNLFSVFAAQDRNQNSEFVLTPTECWLKVNSDVVLNGSRSVNGSLFKANFEPILPKEMIEVHSVVADSSLLQLYHERWGHQDKRHI
ncbi:integrase catalytic domain-containing protein [Trichonephila inaurata madagascariensis]|uniref:Integrase catalytic domain-containing protein n=1 Tax=Trichonephila inaurata madagascariensis TaxID=2747483 RepID=A0A8X6XYC6_9ARAC|nr:integrase catalytic domain-containing protein [Trichonephila inaurata madagascariensis]